MKAESSLASEELVLKAINSKAKSKATILIIDEDNQTCRSLKKSLVSEDYKIYVAHEAHQGKISAASRKPDLILLNIELSSCTGLQLIKTIRSYSLVPIIVISSLKEEAIKIQALETGADDYITKPFGSQEIKARIRAQLRRRTAPTHIHHDDQVFVMGNVIVDLLKHTTTKNGNEVHLTNIEKRLLRVLIATPGKVLSQRFLNEQVWGPNHSDQNCNLRIVICNLRAKLEDDPKNPCYIQTATGVGYRLVI